jgi:hypothetical protein
MPPCAPACSLAGLRSFAPLELAHAGHLLTQEEKGMERERGIRNREKRPTFIM